MVQLTQNQKSLFNMCLIDSKTNAELTLLLKCKKVFVVNKETLGTFVFDFALSKWLWHANPLSYMDVIWHNYS